MKRFTKVTVLGDLNIDVILKVPHPPVGDISVAAEEAHISPGGVGGNVATYLTMLGDEVSLFTGVGSDVIGKYLIQDLITRGVRTDCVKVVSDVPTGTMVIILLPNGERSIVGFRGANQYVEFTRAELERALGGVSHAHASGYFALNRDGGQALLLYLKLAKEVGATTSIDLEGISTQRKDIVPLLRGLVDYVFINKDELRLLTGEDNVSDAATELFTELSPKAIFVKAGKKGSYVLDPKLKLLHVPTKAIIAKDTTGAGDAFNAAVIHELIRGTPPAKAAEKGNATGAEASTRMGARP